MKVKRFDKETAVDKSGGDYEYVGSVNTRWFDEIGDDGNHSEVNAFLKECGSHYGTASIVLTDADIEMLKSGKMLVWGQGEYATVIYYGQVEE